MGSAHPAGPEGTVEACWPWPQTSEPFVPTSHLLHAYFLVLKTNRKPFRCGQQRSHPAPPAACGRDARVGQRNFLFLQGHNRLILSPSISICCSCSAACDPPPACTLRRHIWKRSVSRGNGHHWRAVSRWPPRNVLCPTTSFPPSLLPFQSRPEQPSPAWLLGCRPWGVSVPASRPLLVPSLPSGSSPAP